VIARDQIINGLQVKADEDCVNLIALRQPLGSDLRMIMSLSNIRDRSGADRRRGQKIARMTMQDLRWRQQPAQRQAAARRTADGQTGGRTCCTTALMPWPGWMWKKR
jgi:hypothetical protein